MNRIAARLQRASNDLLGIQISRRPPARQRQGLFGPQHVQSAAVILAVNRHTPDAEIAGRTQNPHRNFPAVGHQ